MNTRANLAYKNADSHAKYQSTSSTIIKEMFRVCSDIALELAEACQKGNIEKRALLIEKIVRTLNVIELNLIQNTSAEKKAAAFLMRFMTVISNELIKINMSNDAKQAHVIAHKLEKLSLVVS